MTKPERTIATRMVSYAVLGMKAEEAEKVTAQLNALSDLTLTLKHVHWSVTGPHFIAVHAMLDPQVDAIREMADQTAERIAALSASPTGTPAPWSRSGTGMTTPFPCSRQRRPRGAGRACRRWPWCAGGTRP